MIKRALGKTGIAVSELSFGCVEIGMPYGLGRAAASGMPDEAEAVHLLQDALLAGINFFDTARMYGVSENLIGKAFRQKRKEVIVATKCRHFLHPDGSIPGYNDLKMIITGSLYESLDALQTDYVDVFMLHQADEQIVGSEAVCSVFAELKQQGLVRATGVSTYTNGQTALAIDTGSWDVIQVPFNLLDQRQSALFGKAHAAGIALVVRSVLLKGLLGSKMEQLHPALNPVAEHIKRYASLCGRLGIGLPALAIRFALSFPQVSAVLVGIDQQTYLQEAVNAAAGDYLSTPVLQEAAAMAYPDPGFIDLPRWDREGWLK